MDPQQESKYSNLHGEEFATNQPIFSPTRSPEFQYAKLCIIARKK